MDVEKAIEFILQNQVRHQADIVELRQLHIAAERRTAIMERRADRYVRLGTKMMDRMREDTDRKINALNEKFDRWLDSQPKRNGSDRPQ